MLILRVNLTKPFKSISMSRFGLLVFFGPGGPRPPPLIQYIYIYIYIYIYMIYTANQKFLDSKIFNVF